MEKHGICIKLKLKLQIYEFMLIALTFICYLSGTATDEDFFKHAFICNSTNERLKDAQGMVCPPAALKIEGRTG